MNLENPQDILGEVTQVLESAPNNLRASLLRDILMNALKCKRDDLDILDLKVINRAVAEFRHASTVFRPYRDIRKVSIFGSARTPETDPYYTLAAGLGVELVKHGFMVITGAAAGIMRAGIDGAGPTKSFGVNILLPFEKMDAGALGPGSKLLHFKYFFVRKIFFVMEADGFAVFPGGFGTHDETFEVLTLLQTGKTPPRPLLLVERPGDGYWRAWDRFVRTHMLGQGYISPEDLSFYRIVPSAADAVAAIRHYYSTFHSVRQVRERLVVRLERPLSESAIGLLNERFGDLVTAGGIVSSPALPEEADEPGLLQNPRLVFSNRQGKAGRLNQLILAVNDLGAAQERRTERRKKPAA
jgi:hypothetical protein